MVLVLEFQPIGLLERWPFTAASDPVVDGLSDFFTKTQQPRASPVRRQLAGGRNQPFGAGRNEKVP